MRSDFLTILEQRGFIHQCSNIAGLDAAMMQEILRAYIGFDATAPSLHVGSLVQIMMLYWLQHTGGQPIVLMGGGTSKVGDPSFKDTQRQALSDEVISCNIKTIKGVFERFLHFGAGASDALIVDNLEWLGTLKYLDFLRDYGQHFTINRMLSFDSVRLRLERESPLTLLEFNYMVMQGYDFLELYRRHGVRLQMGGSDQWGNMVNGLELVRRVQGAEVFVLTTPLLTTANGAKMGKTEGGAVWLNADMLAPYDYYQYWRNVADTDVGRFLRLFTTLPLTEIERLEALRGEEINEAKKVLALEATRLAHGDEAAESAAVTAQNVFERSDLGADLPHITLPCGPVPLIDLLVATGLCASKGEAKRLITGGGARVNDIPVDDLAHICEVNVKPLKLSAGKKKHAVVKGDVHLIPISIHQ